MRKSTTAFAIGFLSPYLFAQSTVDEFYEDASRLTHEKSYAAAIIQLKNALQLNPEHMPSLVLSAETYIGQDNYPAAEEALIKARVLGADRKYINLTLAKIYKHQGKYQSIIDEISTRNLPPRIVADLLGYKAMAWLSLGKSTKAQELIEQSQQLNPNSLQTLVATALVAINQREFVRAIEIGEQSTTLFPSSPESWNIYAAALHGNGQLQSALNAYQATLQYDERHVDARVSKSALALDLGLLQEADKDLAYLGTHFPYEPRAAYLRALLYTKQSTDKKDLSEETRRALRICVEVISRLPTERVSNDKQLPMFAAQAHYALSEFEASKAYLSAYLKKNNRDPGANRLMGDILVRLNDPVAAIKYLRPVHRIYPNDAKLVSLLATAYSQSGRYDKATELLSTLKNSQDSPDGINSRLAISLMQAGHSRSAIEGLAQVFKESQGEDASGFSLVVALLQKRQFGEALKYAEQLSENEPDNIAYLNLLGVAQQSAGQIDQARQSFRRILSQVPDNFSATVNLAKLESNNNNNDEAYALLAKTLERYPNASALQFALAQLEEERGNLQGAIALAEKARIDDPENLDIRLALLGWYIRVGRNDDAETLALDTNVLDDNSFESTITLANVYQHIGKPRKALSIYKLLAKEAGYHSERLYLIAMKMIELQALKDARHTLFKAIEGNPNDLAALSSYISIQITLKEYEDAYQRSLELVDRHPNKAISYLMLGNSLEQLDRFKQAIAEYQRGLEQSFMPDLVLGLAKANLAIDNRTAARKALEEHWQRHPTVGSAYSVLLINNREWLEAKSILASLLKMNERQPTHLNNMAYVLDQLNDHKAIEYAQRAHEISPQNPYVNDTVGWLLVKAGNPDKGLKYLRQAVARASSLPEIRYHLGKALFALGRHAEAKRELQFALESGTKFDGYQDAKDLLKSLS